ncbi:MAG TPA: DUF2760 domain-containing protein [Planctomycetaceae bacterium]|nr:DUF2760 domain-containing protein [Planctomycetaceae bacterium]
MSIVVAFRAFFAALFNSQKSKAIQALLDGAGAAAAVPQIPAPVAKSEPEKPLSAPAAVAKPIRNDAVTLLATLQREARLIDLVQEPLDQYSDAQVGAAARPCLSQCRATIARIFDVRPLVPQSEGQSVEVPESASPLRYQWVGDAAAGKRSGNLVHAGWQATRCEIAQWTGSADDASVIAPAQIEP